MKKLLLLILVLLAGAGGYTYLRNGKETVTVYRTAKVERGDLVVSITATGTVEPEEVIDVGAQVAGLILTFGTDVDGKPIDYGSRIAEGTILANIDDALYTSEVAQAEAQVVSSKGGLQRAQADLLQLKAKLEQAERNWKRAEQLGPGTTALSGTDYDNYRTSFEAAQANVAVGEAAIVEAQGSRAQAESALTRAKRNLGYTTIKSPVNGVIIDRRVNIGQTVVASLNAPSLFLIAKDLTRMQVWVAVNEADIGKLHPDQPVTFTVDAFPGETFKGKVNKIRLNASMTQNVVTYTVEVTADNSSGRLLPYLTANVRFELQRKDNVLLVPNAALHYAPAADRVSPEVRKLAESSPGRDTQNSQSTHGDQHAASAPASGPEAEPGAIWVAEGRYVRPIPVHVGLTDDVVTEVHGPGITAGMEVVTGEDEEATAAQSSTSTNPFLPKFPRGGARRGPPPPA